MKKIFALFAFAALLLTGCYAEDVPVGPGIPEDTAEAEIYVEPETITTTFGGGEYQISILSNASWVISCDQQDVSFDTISGAGNAVVTAIIPKVNAARNFSIKFKASKMAMLDGIAYTSTAEAAIAVYQNESGDTSVATNVKEVRALLSALEVTENRTDITDELKAMTLTGIVVAEPNGNMSNDYTINVQDESTEANSGLTVYNVENAKQLKKGDVVKFSLATAQYQYYKGLLQLVANTSAEIIAEGLEVNPIEVTYADLANYEAQYVKVNGLTPPQSAIGNAWNSGTSGVNVNFSTENNETLVVRINKFASFKDELVPNKKGSLCGVVSVYNTTVQFQPQYLSDIQLTEDIPVVDIMPVTIADVLAGGAGNYKVENAWAVATYANGALLTDASGAYILAFQPSTTPAAGEVVNIEGSVSAYAGLLQFGAGAVVTKTGETRSISHPTAEVMDAAALDAYLTAPVVKYVEYEGVLASGNYYNVTIEGATTAIGSISYPGDELKAQLNELNGKSIKVSGYLIGVSSSKYANTMAVSVVESENAVPETPKTTIADVLAGGAGNYKVENAWAVATYANGALLTDASGAYILAFQPSTTPAAGEVVNIEGSVSAYAGLLQFGAGAVVTKTGETRSISHPTAEVMDAAALDAYLTAPAVKYVEYEGTLGVSTNSSGTATYYNVTINGAATAIGSVQYPTEEIKTQLSALDGKLVKVTGYLIGVSSSKYANTMAVSVVESENAVPETPKATIAEVLAGGAGTYKVENAWAVATYDRGSLLTDASGAYILAFLPSTTPAVGEVVNIEGTVSAYAGLLQFGKGATVTKTGETTTVTHPAAEVMNGTALDAYLAAPAVKYVEYEGTLGVSTNSSGTTTYYNVTINGAATAIGSVQYPTEDIKAQLATLDGKSIKITGYLIGVSSNKYTNTMAVSVAEVVGDESNGTENITPGNEQNPGWN